GLRDLDHGLRILHPPRKFLRKPALVGPAEGRGIAAAAAADRADDLKMLRAHVLEQGRLGRGLDHGADIGQGERLRVDLDLAEIDQALDKTSQAKLFEIDTVAGAIGGQVSPRAKRIGGNSLVLRY